MLETVIQSVLSGGVNQPPKKETSAESGKTEFQDLLAAAKDKLPADKKDTSESDKVQEPIKPDTDGKEFNEEEQLNGTQQPNGAEQMILLFGMPQILQTPDTSILETPVISTAQTEAAAAVEMPDVSGTENTVQKDGEHTMAMQQGKVEDHTFAMQGKPSKETVEVAQENQKPSENVENMENMQTMQTKTSKKTADVVSQYSEKTKRPVGETTEGTEKTVLPETVETVAHPQTEQGIQQPKAKEVLPHVPVNEAEPQKMTKDISDVIAKGIQNGKQEFEIQLEPLHLGKLAIKVTYEAGKAAVSILCSSTKTLEAMAQNAKEIGAILDYRLGTDTQIVVERPETDYLNQQNQQNEQGQSSQKEQEQSQKEQNAYSRDGANQTDFLQQLRLGLV